MQCNCAEGLHLVLFIQIWERPGSKVVDHYWQTVTHWHPGIALLKLARYRPRERERTVVLTNDMENKLTTLNVVTLFLAVSYSCVFVTKMSLKTIRDCSGDLNLVPHSDAAALNTL